MTDERQLVLDGSSRGRPRVVVLQLASIAMLIGLAAVLLVVRGGDFDVNGAVVLDSQSRDTAPGSCTGVGTYDDIGTGAQVTLVNELGDVVSAGTLQAGSRDAQDRSCVFAFVLTDVPDGEDVYRLRIAGRGAMPFDKGGLTDGPLLSLGGV